MVSSATQTLMRISISDRWLRSMLGAVLAVAGASGICAADEAPSPSTEAPVPAEAESATPRPPMARAPRRHYSSREIIDANVQRLAHGLQLDPGQQTKLREILVVHYQALTKLRSGAAPGTDRSGAMRAIVDRTRERIRSILNDAQKQRYSTDVSTELAGPSRADLEHWLDVRDAAAPQAPAPSAKEN